MSASRCGGCGTLVSTGHFHSCTTTPVRDHVSAPSHYIVGGYECRKVIQALGLSWPLGNAFAYIWRAGRKTPDKTEDIRKAIECLQFELEQLGKAGQ